MSKPRQLTPAELDALELILPTGAGDGTSQPRLSVALGWDAKGRKVRQGFQQLRRERHLRIVALPTPNGCYVATHADIKALKQTRDGLRSRAMSELDTVKEMDLVIAEMEWSPCLPIEAAL